MTKALYWKVGLAVALTLTTAVSFAAYLRPEMMLEFANLMLCGPAL
jgi:hypothetical protein